MDGSKAKGTWCMLKYAGDIQKNNEIINRTTLRFRPIAPKPVSSDTVSGNLLVDNKNLLLTSKRSKRKYVRVRKNNGCERKKNNTETDHHDDGLNQNVETLQLLPEKPTATKDLVSLSRCNNNDLDLKMGSKVDDNREDLTAAKWINFKGKDIFNRGVSDQTVEMCRRRVTVESWVTVESVTDTCMDATRGLFGCTDVERMKINMENDKCPGFISDGFNRVMWVNKAYKKMVLNGDGKWPTSPEIEIMVWLVIKEKLPSFNFNYHSTFTTKVRLQYTWQSEKYSKIVPCDVLRMDGGGFAWRLDVEAALSLGR